MANLTENPQIKSFAQLRGHTRIWKNDELVFDEDNAIIPGGTTITATPDGLKAYLAQCLYPGTVVNTPTNVVDRAINDLFTTSNVTGSNYVLENRVSVDALFSGKDGIIVAATDAPVADSYAMITTNVAKTQAYGRKWRGSFTATGARQLGTAAIGFGLKSNTSTPSVPSGIGDMFTCAYANQTFSTITLANGDSLTIEWEIYIA